MADTLVEHDVARFQIPVAWLCGLVLTFEGYDIASAGYAIPSLVEAWAVHPQVFTQTLAAGNVGLLLGSLWAGLLGDRLGRKPVLLGCVMIFGVFSVLSALAGSPSQLAELRFLTGLGLGGGIPLAIAFASDFAPLLTKGRLVILVSAGVPIGFAAGGLVASQLVSAFGWPAIFVVGGVLPLATMPLLGWSLPESVALRAATRPRKLVAALFETGRAPMTFVLWVINLLSLLALYFILLWTPAILHAVGATPSRAIFASTLYALGVVAGPLLAAPVVDRAGMERVLAGGFGFGALCVFSIGWFNPQYWLLAVLLFGAGIGGGCQAGVNALSALVYPPEIRSTGSGWALGLGRVGAIAGPLLGGALLSLGFGGQDMFIAAAIPFLGAALLMVIVERLHRQ